VSYAPGARYTYPIVAIRSKATIYMPYQKPSRMNKRKKTLLLLLSVTIVMWLITLAFFKSPPPDLNNPEIRFNFVEVVLFICAVLTILYAWLIKCPNPTCKKRQVLRGSFGWTLRWPTDTCYDCGTSMEAKYKDSRPLE